jgi:ribonuclease T1
MPSCEPSRLPAPLHELNPTMQNLTRFFLISLLLAAGLATENATALQSNTRQAAARPADLAIIPAQALPREVLDTLAIIKKGGPFAYSKDGTTFSNREHALPRQGRGYYREYTVKTPGARNRGAQRIIAGAPGEYYYTDDHYATFKRIKE